MQITIYLYIFSFPVLVIMALIIELTFKLPNKKVNFIIKLLACLWVGLGMLMITRSILWTVSTLVVFYFVLKLITPEIEKWYELAERYRKK